MIPVGAGRAPVFSAAVSGSITHTHHYCAAAVIPSAGELSIGIDAETDTPLDKALEPLVMSDIELAQLVGLNRQAPCTWSKLFFSAKEAFHKAIFPRHQEMLDFREVVMEVWPEQQAFEIQVVKPTACTALSRRTFIGRYRFDGGLVVSAIAISW
jgi:4'-phosphopantetheinyl transferase EntD